MRKNYIKEFMEENKLINGEHFKVSREGDSTFSMSSDGFFIKDGVNCRETCDYYYESAVLIDLLAGNEHVIKEGSV